MKKESLLILIPKLIMAVILIIGIVAVFGILGYFKTIPKNGYKTTEIAEKPIIKKEIKCPENWKEYKHDIVGIKFCYPEEWGRLTTSPKSEITRIEDVVSEFDSEHNRNYNSFFIEFENNKNISLRFFNEQYGGEYYPNSYAYAHGYVDNIPLLKSTGDICKYKIDFNENWRNKGKLNEIYNSCDKDIKTTVIEHYQYFDFIEDNNKSRYLYDLKGFAYKKLSNSYFDNLLISIQFGYVSQSKEQLTNFDQILSSLEKSEAQFQKEKDEFSDFVKSIEAYQPIPKTFSEFKIINGENPQITVIRKYYWLLTNGKLNEAYKMRFDQTELTYETFQNWYKDVYHAKPYDFKETNSDEYEFYIEYQDHNKPKKKFRVKMSVNEDKIKTIFSDEILTKEVSFGEYSAYAIKRGDKNYMILAENGKEIIIDEGGANYDSEYSNLIEVKSFREPKFSPKGNYLIYLMSGWEWSAYYVYDVKNKTVKISGLGHGFDFTPDEKYFYTCSSMGMITGADGEVYSVPDFDIKFNALDKVEDGFSSGVGCRYEEENENIIFTFIDDKGDVIETKVFSVSNSVK